MITFVKDYEPLVKATPLERVVIETDAPYVTPEPHRRKRNEPSYVKFVAQKLAELHNVDFGVVQEKTTRNALAVFKIDTI